LIDHEVQLLMMKNLKQSVNNHNYT